jgi:hypothetical protein
MKAVERLLDAQADELVAGVGHREIDSREVFAWIQIRDRIKVGIAGRWLDLLLRAVCFFLLFQNPFHRRRSLCLWPSVLDNLFFHRGAHVLAPNRFSYGFECIQRIRRSGENFRPIDIMDCIINRVH